MQDRQFRFSLNEGKNVLGYEDHRTSFFEGFRFLMILSGFPLGLEKLENLEKWEGIFQSGKSQGILNRLEKSGKSQGKPHKILEN